MKCANCGNHFNDGVHCNGCKKDFDFGCALISEVSYRKLGADRRVNWRCSHCKSVTPKQTASESVTLETVLSELREQKELLKRLPELLNDVKSIKDEIMELKLACEFNSTKLDEFESRIVTVEKKVTTIQQSQNSVSSDDIELLRKDNANREQWSRLNNVEVKGVPSRNAENLFSVVQNICTAVGYSFPQSQINYIARVPQHNSKNKSMIISFINRYVKEEFVAAARAKKRLLASDIGFATDGNQVFINDHLIPETKKLLTRVKELAKKRGFSYVWVRYCKIHVRKNDSSPSHVIAKESDLNKIV